MASCLCYAFTQGQYRPSWLLLLPAIFYFQPSTYASNFGVRHLQPNQHHCHLELVFVVVNTSSRLRRPSWQVDSSTAQVARFFRDTKVVK